MSKSLITNSLSERSATRALLAISLCASMVAFGCTTDRNLGNGDPVITPGSRNSPTSGTSVGSESEPLPPPMMSSSMSPMSPDAAAAIMAQQQPRVQVLGLVAPGNGDRAYASDQLIPQQQTEQRYSVNSTIYSKPTWVITSGADEPPGGNVPEIPDDPSADFLGTIGVLPGTDTLTSANNAASTFPGSSVASGVAPTISSGTSNGKNLTNAAAPVIAPSATAVTPTSSAFSAPTGFASVRTLSPVAASVVNPPASISGSPAVATASSARTNATTRTTTTSTATVSSTSSTNAGMANPVRVVNTNGRVVITNGGATRQQ